MITHPLRPGCDAMKNKETFTRELAFFIDHALLTHLAENGKISTEEATAIQEALVQSYRPIYTVGNSAHRLDIPPV